LETVGIDVREDRSPAGAGDGLAVSLPEEAGPARDDDDLVAQVEQLVLFRHELSAASSITSPESRDFFTASAISRLRRASRIERPGPSGRARHGRRWRISPRKS